MQKETTTSQLKYLAEQAILNKQPEFLQSLFRKYQRQLADPYYDLLSLSVSINDVELSAYLLNQGLNPFVQNPDQYAPLQMAVIKEDNGLRHIEIFLTAHFVEKWHAVSCAIINAVQNANQKALELLIRHTTPFSKNDCDSHGNNALHYLHAAFQNNKDHQKCLQILDCLLDYGFSLEHENNYGETPLEFFMYYAKSNQPKSTRDQIRKKIEKFALALKQEKEEATKQRQQAIAKQNTLINLLEKHQNTNIREKQTSDPDLQKTINSALLLLNDLTQNLKQTTRFYEKRIDKIKPFLPAIFSEPKENDLTQIPTSWSNEFPNSLMDDQYNSCFLFPSHCDSPSNTDFDELGIEPLSWPEAGLCDFTDDPLTDSLHHKRKKTPDEASKSPKKRGKPKKD